MNTGSEWFKDWFGSPYYHQLYFKRDDRDATGILNRLVNYLKPEPGSFLMEAGCGKGGHASILAGYGFDVTGIDLSFENIEEAKLLESGKLHFFQHDMRLPFWMNYFNYTFSLFTSFGYFRTEREHYNSIRTIANSLKPAGTLVMDYLNVHYAEDHLVHKTEKEIDGINFFITKWYDETHFYKKIIVEDDLLQEPLVFQEKVAKFSLGDFNDMLAFHRLQIQEVFGDYELGSFDLKNSPRMLMIARKV
jgi:SAM-dependent methyltransferase